MATTIRPHKIGLAFVLLAVAMLAAAINYGNNLIFFISFLFVSLLLNSAWQSWRSLASAEVVFSPVEPHFADEAGVGILQVRARLPNPAVSLWVDGALVTDFGWNAGTSQHAFDLPLLPRGRYPPANLVLSSQFPLGLWNARRSLTASTDFHWVYPARMGNLPLPLVAQGKTGDVGAARSGTDEEFDHLRPYVPGDAQSRIAFKQFARTGQLVSQQWSGQTIVSHGAVLLDFTAIPGTTEQRLCQLSFWIQSLADGNRTFTLRLPGLADLFGHDAHHRQVCWQRLATFGRAVDEN